VLAPPRLLLVGDLIEDLTDTTGTPLLSFLITVGCRWVLFRRMLLDPDLEKADPVEEESVVV
jgi:hypothetical protein